MLHRLLYTVVKQHWLLKATEKFKVTQVKVLRCQDTDSCFDSASPWSSEVPGLPGGSVMSHCLSVQETVLLRPDFLGLENASTWKCLTCTSQEILREKKIYQEISKTGKECCNLPEREHHYRPDVTARAEAGRTQNLGRGWPTALRVQEIASLDC